MFGVLLRRFRFRGLTPPQVQRSDPSSGSGFRGLTPPQVQRSDPSSGSGFRGLTPPQDQESSLQSLRSGAGVRVTCPFVFRGELYGGSTPS
ncbi:putative 13.8 kDa protein in nqo9-nqo10 intergenic region [Dissostichus eleginoides]|uniref:13.8 kDa protein in nqo9-nqo10 intergenic region n=1 Tax=Dissostichus eleginoides TaxID=100907 RepID=A0AAD9B368_DISEL|nr:putative 13.8 kDa protein in nqo9-nqo10 intergenic region [Dissostichus eleginoides]